MLLVILSSAMRILSYIFLRWLPGALFPKLIVAIYIIWVTLFVSGHRSRIKTWSVLGDRGSLASDVANMLVNIILLGFVVDAAFGDWWLNDYEDLHFAKVGFVSDHHAKIGIRLPGGIPNLNLCYAPIANKSSTICRSLETVSEDKRASDLISTYALRDLSSDTAYEYFVSSGAEERRRLMGGVFTTASSLNSKWSFLASPCVVSNFPYHPWRRNVINGWEELFSHELDIREQETFPRFMFFLGDFIYYDLPFFPRYSTAAYFKKYRRHYASPSFRKVYERLPLLHVYDDHDVVNNFDNGEESEPYPFAHQAFQAYHGSTNPTPLVAEETWYEHTYGGVHFFMLDTRRYRSPNRLPDDCNKTMLGSRQLDALLQWIERDETNYFEIIISSIPFTENWKGVDGAHLDTWGGFLNERLKIIRAVEKSGKIVVVISGDRHEFAATKVQSSEPVAAKRGHIVDISISPLNQFYLPIPTYSNHINDTELNYSPRGNVKWGKFTVDRTGHVPRLDFELKIHGQSRWNYTLYRDSTTDAQCDYYTA